jgi:hypothetical protein
MKITIKKQTEETVEITPPFFWKNEQNVVGLLDENTVVTAYKGAVYASVQNQTAYMGQSDIRKAIDEMQPCSELDFFTFFDEVIEIVSLKAIKTEKL